MIDEAEINKTLKSVPSSFALEHIVSKKAKKDVESIISKLKKEEEDAVFDLDEEYIRDYNLISYLYWSLGERNRALEYNAKALGKDKINLIAAANQTRFYLSLNEPAQLQNAYTNLVTVKKQNNYETILLSGQAEIAYNYTRLGFRQYEKAVKEFQNILEKAQLIDDIDQSVIFLWKFGLGLTFRRLSHTGNIGNEFQAAAADERLKDAVRIFVEIIESDWMSQRCKALAYVQLADSFFNVKLAKKKYRDYFPEKYCKLEEDDFYQKAESICPKEPYILERYGKYLRTQRSLEEAEDRLRKSISIRPTSTAHHHLALTLKFKLYKQYNLPPYCKKPFNRQFSEMAPCQKESHVRNLFPDDSKQRGSASSEQVVQKQEGIQFMDASTPFDSGVHSLTSSIETRFGAACKRERKQTEHDSKAKYSASSVEVKKKEGVQQMDDSTPFDSGICNLTSSVESRVGAVGGAERKQTETADPPFQEDVANNSLSTSLKHMSLAENANIKQGDGYSKMASKDAKHTGLVPEEKDDSYDKLQTANVRSGPKGSINPAMRNWRNMIKSPTKVPFLSEKDTRPVLYQLNKAIELTNNRAAKYDKGLILRSRKDFDGAIAVFKTLMDEETSLMYLANAYEQCAFCLQDKLLTISYNEKAKKDIVYDQKSFLMKAIAVSAKLAGGIPNVTEVWASGTTLKTILLGEAKTKGNLKDLAMLSERLRENSSAIAYYEEIMSMDESEQKNPTLLMKIAENQMHDKNYIEAISFLEIVSMLPEGKEYIDQNVYKKALIEAGFESVKSKQDIQIGSKYLKSAINPAVWSNVLKSNATDDSEPHVENEDDRYDIFILNNESDTDSLVGALEITNFLKKDCQLNATMNLQDMVCGTLELSSLFSVIDRSNNMIIFVDSSCRENKIYQYCVEHIIRRNINMMLVLEAENVELPGILASFKSKIPSLVYEATETNKEQRLDLMKSMFYKLSGYPTPDCKTLYERLA